MQMMCKTNSNVPWYGAAISTSVETYLILIPAMCSNSSYTLNFLSFKNFDVLMLVHVTKVVHLLY